MTLIEIMMSLAGLAVVAAALISAFAVVTGVDALHSSDDAALQTLREVRQRISRDVREARGFVVIGPAAFTVWMDDDWDGVQDLGERITWVLSADGSLRWVDNDENSTVLIRGLDPDLSGFSYDSNSPSNVRSATVSLVSKVTAGIGGERSIEFDVSLRNIP
jgi:type II secretory pathway pseudopilin PulG